MIILLLVLKVGRWQSGGCADLAVRSWVTAFTQVMIHVGLHAHAVTVLPYLHRQTYIQTHTHTHKHSHSAVSNQQ